MSPMVWTNALLVLMTVWTLAGGGQPRLGNWLAILAGGTGFVVMVDATLWPLVGMNAVLVCRAMWVLWRMEDV